MHDDPASAFPWPLRVRLWDEALAVVRACLREQGLREVSTPIRSTAVALEPWIEPIATHGASGSNRAGDERWLASSPELPMKQLLCRGAGSIFQLAHVFRAAEEGPRHREEFHLLEWYRAPGKLPEVIADVERVVERCMLALAPILAEQGLGAPQPPRRWLRVELLELVRETTGMSLRGDEAAAAIEPWLADARARLRIRWAGPDDPSLVDAPARVRDLVAWTEFFSLWSELELDPWLARQPSEVGVHVLGFPRSLAALACVEGGRAERFESHVGGVELANGYLELRDAIEQRQRFEAVAGLRSLYGLPALPLPEAFLSDLATLGLPPCAGVALGFDRLLSLACGCSTLDAIALADR